jgi:MoaA/NifB/PqqE/SkfB family radical SAM enzyme
MGLAELMKLGSLETWANYQQVARKDLNLKYLFWECTLTCNFLCKHCGSNASSKVHTDELDTREIKDVFKKIADRTDPRKIMIAVTGGEPLLRRDLFEVMGYANNLGFAWGMVTNGSLVNEKNIKSMRRAGLS